MRCIRACLHPLLRRRLRENEVEQKGKEAQKHTHKARQRLVDLVPLNQVGLAGSTVKSCAIKPVFFREAYVVRQSP